MSKKLSEALRLKISSEKPLGINSFEVRVKLSLIDGFLPSDIGGKLKRIITIDETNNKKQLEDVSQIAKSLITISKHDVIMITFGYLAYFSSEIDESIYKIVKDKRFKAGILNEHFFNFNVNPAEAHELYGSSLVTLFENLFQSYICSLRARLAYAEIVLSKIISSDFEFCEEIDMLTKQLLLFSPSYHGCQDIRKIYFKFYSNTQNDKKILSNLSGTLKMGHLRYGKEKFDNYLIYGYIGEIEKFIEKWFVDGKSANDLKNVLHLKLSKLEKFKNVSKNSIELIVDKPVMERRNKIIDLLIEANTEISNSKGADFKERLSKDYSINKLNNNFIINPKYLVKNKKNVFEGSSWGEFNPIILQLSEYLTYDIHKLIDIASVMEEICLGELRHPDYKELHVTP